MDILVCSEPLQADSKSLKCRLGRSKESYISSVLSWQKRPQIFRECIFLERFVQHHGTLAVSRRKERGKKASKRARGPFWKSDFHGVASSLSGWEELNEKGPNTGEFRQKYESVARKAADMMDALEKGVTF